MKTFLCTVCGHVAFNEVPEHCPVCGVAKEKFEEKSDLIHKPGAPDTAGEPEKKHIPSIVVVKKCGLIGEGCVDVHVKVGEIEHPMLKEHYITFIDFYLEHRFIARTHLTPGTLHPAAALHLKADTGRLTAIEHCNVHGYWLSETTL